MDFFNRNADQIVQMVTIRIKVKYASLVTSLVQNAMIMGKKTAQLVNNLLDFLIINV